MTFNFVRAVVMTNTCAKGQSQWSLGSKFRVDMDGHTDGLRRLVLVISHTVSKVGAYFQSIL